MKIHPLGAKLFYEDGQINVTKQLEFNKIRDEASYHFFFFLQFCESA